MYRVTILYDQEPDADAYAGHAEVCRTVPNVVFRHGKVFGSPMGEPKYAYQAEFEFADKDAFRAGTASDEFQGTVKDLQERGLAFPSVVLFADVD